MPSSVAAPEAEVDFEIDESSWPIVVARWHGRPSDASLIAALARMDGLLARNESFGVIVDARGSRPFTPEQRGMIVTHMKRNESLTTRYLVQAFVTDNIIMRTMYWGVQVLLPAPFPSKVFRDVDSARAWIADVLGARRA